MQLLPALVDFYNITSHWDDNRHEIRMVASNLETINVGHYTDHLLKLNSLLEIFSKNGRDGRNNTISGDKITSENIFLGKKRNLRTIKFWLAFREDKLSEENLPSKLRNLSLDKKQAVIQIINHQAEVILEKGRDIIDIISSLEKKLI